MATFHTGQGGSFTAAATEVEGVRNWKLSLTSLLAETTNASSGGIQQWLKILTGGTWSCDVILDSTNLPDTDLSMAEGDTIALVFNIGDSSKTYSFTGIVETLEISCPANDVVSYSLSGKINSAVTDPTT